MKKKYDFFMFDLDGVLINSIGNMKVSWKEATKEAGIKVKFSEYRKHIGLPFRSILKNLKINKKFFNKIESKYNITSKKNFKLIKLYPGVKKLFQDLKKNRIKYSIITSKDYHRTKAILKKNNLKPSTIHCPTNKLKKPDKRIIFNCLKINNFSKKNCIYIGDSFFDKKMAYDASVDFLFASYGYSKIKIKKNKILKKISDISKYI